MNVEMYYGCDLVILHFLVYLSVVIKVIYLNLFLRTLQQK